MINSDATTCSKDVNDAFFDIALAENKFSDLGHQDGFAEGLLRGWKNGFDLGVVKGSQIGSEVAFYLGFATLVKLLIEPDCESHPSSKRILKILESIDETASTFPSTLSLDSSVSEHLDTIRAKFKQACSLMNVSLESTGKHKLDF